MLTAKHLAEDKCKGFTLGVDDYVVKPFRIRELIARVKRTLEKNSSGSANVIEIGSVKVDVKVGKVFVFLLKV